jgi:diguanylate cyclase (GGDEF)-like protein
LILAADEARTEDPVLEAAGATGPPRVVRAQMSKVLPGTAPWFRELAKLSKISSVTFGSDRRATDNEQAAKLGVLVVAASSLVVAATVWFLPATPPDRMIAMAIAAGAFLVSIGLSRMSWRGLPVQALLVFPVLGLAAITGVALSTHGISPAYMGFYTVAVYYVASTQSERLTLFAIPVLLPFWLVCQGGLSDEVGVKMLITVCIWGLIGHGTSRKKASDEVRVRGLLHAAATDPLTGLASRGELVRVLERTGVGDAVVLIDLDGFKAINDSKGHQVGDDILATFGHSVRGVLRSTDIALRYGGDEIMLVLPQAGVEQSDALLERLRHHWAQPHRPTFSAGIAVRGNEDAQETLRRADDALYQAKERGRDRWSHAVRPGKQPLGVGSPSTTISSSLTPRGGVAIGLIEGPSAAESPA